MKIAHLNLYRENYLYNLEGDNFLAGDTPLVHSAEVSANVERTG